MLSTSGPRHVSVAVQVLGFPFGDLNPTGFDFLAETPLPKSAMEKLDTSFMFEVSVTVLNTDDQAGAWFCVFNGGNL